MLENEVPRPEVLGLTGYRPQWERLYGMWCFRGQSLTKKTERLQVLQQDSSLFAPAAARRQDLTGIR